VPAPRGCAPAATATTTAARRSQASDCLPADRCRARCRREHRCTQHAEVTLNEDGKCVLPNLAEIYSRSAVPFVLFRMLQTPLNPSLVLKALLLAPAAHLWRRRLARGLAAAERESERVRGQLAVVAALGIHARHLAHCEFATVFL